MGFLSGLGIGRSPGLRQPRINDFGQGMSPMMGQQGQMGEIAGMFGGGSAPTPWTQPMMGKPQGGFNIGQAAQGAMGAMNAMGGQQQEQMRPSPFSWFGQFQPWR